MCGTMLTSRASPNHPRTPRLVASPRAPTGALLPLANPSPNRRPPNPTYHLPLTHLRTSTLTHLHTPTRPHAHTPMTTRVLRFLRSPLFPIFMIVFVDMLGVGITLPVLPLYAQGVSHARPPQTP